MSNVWCIYYFREMARGTREGDERETHANGTRNYKRKRENGGKSQ